MSLQGFNSQTYQHTGGKPVVLDVSGVLSSGKSLAKKNAAEQWAGSTVNMAVQQAAAHKIDKVAINHLKMSPAAVDSSVPRGYSHWLGLGTEQVKGSQLSWNNIKQTASANVSQFGKAIRAGEFSPSAYARETLVQRNFQPVQNLLTGNAGAAMGQSVLATAGVALAGFDVMKNTSDTYKDAKAREANGEQVNKTGETLAAMGKYTLRDAVSWEVAGAGFSVGKAVMPLSVKGVPVGGVLFGAMGGVVAQKGMNTLLKTGDKDPVQQRKALENAQKESLGPDAGNNAFQQVDPIE
jgi:hypothetical protein